jgi:1,4-dihydroxy-2-naphthoate octaprenyltransferase
LLSLEEKSSKKKSTPNFLKINSGRKTFHISIVVIPVAILLFYGIEDKNAWFFGHDYINDYRYRIENNVVYHIGVMVSHYALIVTLSIVGTLISWIIYEVLKLSNIIVNRSALKAIFRVEKTFALAQNTIQNSLMKN